jgi:regulator of RNase E activity RraA
MSINNRLKKLYTPLIADILDEKGVTNNVLNHEIKPVIENSIAAGPAFTVKFSKLKNFPNKVPVDASWSDTLIDMLESVSKDQIIVVETDNCVECATWGELMSHAVKNRGATGVVTDGAIRDVPEILKINPPFPVWGKDYNPRDSKGRIKVSEWGDITINCGGVTVNPEDIVFADLDGIVIIPKDMINEVLIKAEERFSKEGKFRTEVRNGMSVSEAAAKYKVI